jgi:hypothetical protein
MLERSKSSSFAQIHAKSGAHRTTRPALTDCQHDDGKEKPRIVLRVSSLANRVSVEPACSKTPQKIQEPANRMVTSKRRRRSARDQLDEPSSQPK